MKKQLILIMILFTILLASTCWADTSSDTMQVSATVINGCNLAVTGGMTFPDYTFETVTAEGTFDVQCTTGQTAQIELNHDYYSGSTPSLHGLLYRVYKDSAYTDVWGRATYSEQLDYTGTGNTENYTIYGQILGGQYPSAGEHTGTITVTVTW